MERTQIYLTEAEAAALDRVAAERGVTRSHLIREAIDATYVVPRTSQRDRLLAALEEMGAPWQARTDLPDGEGYVERLRGGPVPGEGSTRGRRGRRAGAGPSGTGSSGAGGAG